MTPTHKTGKGRGTRTVEARQFVNVHDFDLAHWAGGVIQGGRNGLNTIRIYRDDTTLEAQRYDWIVRYHDGKLKIVSPEEFRDKYRAIETKGE
jgi:hypothetical protein